MNFSNQPSNTAILNFTKSQGQGDRYHLINCTLHCMGLIASSTQIGFQYLALFFKETRLNWEANNKIQEMLKNLN